MPGQNPVPPPEETPEERDARVTAQNEQRDALRRELLDLQEQVNAARVHADPLAEMARDAALAMERAADKVDPPVAPAIDEQPKGE